MFLLYIFGAWWCLLVERIFWGRGILLFTYMYLLSRTRAVVSRHTSFSISMRSGFEDIAWMLVTRFPWCNGGSTTCGMPYAKSLFRETDREFDFCTTPLLLFIHSIDIVFEFAFYSADWCIWYECMTFRWEFTIHNNYFAPLVLLLAHIFLDRMHDLAFPSRWMLIYTFLSINLFWEERKKHPISLDIWGYFFFIPGVSENVYMALGGRGRERGRWASKLSFFDVSLHTGVYLHSRRYISWFLFFFFFRDIWGVFLVLVFVDVRVMFISRPVFYLWARNYSDPLLYTQRGGVGSFMNTYRYSEGW